MSHDPYLSACSAPRAAIVCGFLLFVAAMPASAYVGPGAGLGVIGTMFGIVAAILLAIIGLFWYPLKRLLGRSTVVAAPGEDDRSIVDHIAPTAGVDDTLQEHPQSDMETGVQSVSPSGPELSAERHADDQRDRPIGNE